MRFAAPFLTVLLAALVMTMAACVTPAASAGAESAAAPVAATLIVKPRTPTDADALTAMMRGTLGAAAGVRYSRPMAGGAHVVHLTAPATRGQVPQLVERLRATQAYEYVDIDVMLKH
jgi:hypothetical protein